jgi:hypothetical protein
MLLSTAYSQILFTQSEKRAAGQPRYRCCLTTFGVTSLLQEAPRHGPTCTSDNLSFRLDQRAVQIVLSLFVAHYSYSDLALSYSLHTPSQQ